MTRAKKIIRPLFKTHGGKWRYAKHYVAAMDHRGCHTYVENFAGGAGVLFNIPPGSFKEEILVEKNTYIYNTYLTCRDFSKSVHSIISKTQYSENSFKKALGLIDSPTPVVAAAAYITANRMSSGGRMDRYAQTDTSVRLRGGRMGDENAWINFHEKHFFDTCKRLKNVDITNECGIEFFASRFNAKGFLWFMDPPYVEDVLVTKDNYDVRMTKEEHSKMLKYCNLSYPTRSSRIYICGYENELYGRSLTKWDRAVFDRPADSGRTKTKSRRLECLWSNTTRFNEANLT